MLVRRHGACPTRWPAMSNLKPSEPHTDTHTYWVELSKLRLSGRRIKGGCDLNGSAHDGVPGWEGSCCLGMRDIMTKSIYRSCAQPGSWRLRQGCIPRRRCGSLRGTNRLAKGMSVSKQPQQRPHHLMPQRPRDACQFVPTSCERGGMQSWQRLPPMPQHLI